MEQMSMFGCPTAYKSSRITRQTRRESNEKNEPCQIWPYAKLSEESEEQYYGT